MSSEEFEKHLELRPVGTSDLLVTPVALGTWPMAGMTTLEANDQDSLATIRRALELGINFIDTAYCYGEHGESETLVGQVIGDHRDSVVLASKCGMHYETGKQLKDARPETIHRECDETLARIGTNWIDLYYLHAPDPNVPVAESAGAILELIEAGKVRYAGASNCHLPQIEEFHATCPLLAVQLPYNMLQRDIEEQTIPWCQENNVAVVVYWALMKGLLAGRITSLDQLAENDSRHKYPMYQGEEFEKNVAFVERLRQIAAECEKTIAELVVNWTVTQPGITAALCGAKRPWQFEEVVGALGWQFTEEQREAIDQALSDRGHAEAKRIFK